MSALFQYSVPGDMVAGCLDVLERAAERAARGESVVLGGRERREAKLTKKTGRGVRRNVSAEYAARVVKLYRGGMALDAITAAVNSKRSQVEYVLYHLSRHKIELRGKGRAGR